jgi:hypothetical protein
MINRLNGDSFALEFFSGDEQPVCALGWLADS